ncbi:hypothetical protein GCM10007860_30330 [Chitiniphilus shinanonensis]|uniref:Uncharacterized protein n=1 Tax=Chitiniphilus shinanonensis TaxID=553088 RepID=A0ABQ6C037_9NEIS|nr:hypothetical protein GCM10007860_30330 [Chitiniphilus shinanonensis]
MAGDAVPGKQRRRVRAGGTISAPRGKESPAATAGWPGAADGIAAAEAGGKSIQYID